MAATSTPPRPNHDFADGGARVHREGEWLWLPLRREWKDVTHSPEEVVRQEWVRRLHVDGGYTLEQMTQELRDTHGRQSPRVDVVVWKDTASRQEGRPPVLVVETKAAQGPVLYSDFRQGESYALATGAGFLIAATATMSAYYEIVRGAPVHEPRELDRWPKLEDFSDAKKMKALRESLRVFDRDEFQKLLFDCHNLLRNNHAMTPDRAFDTISKILFIKMHLERTGDYGTFTTDYLDQAARFRRQDVPIHDQLFDETKDAYRADQLFEDTDKLEISEATFRAIVAKLGRFNLSETGDDVKGIAFERFLGRTFRGELGQYFTPRPVVDFIVSALDPHEHELICDPAAGSGGFLIAAFDHVRAQIAADIETQKQAARDAIIAKYGDDDPDADLTDQRRAQLDERDREIDKAIAALNGQLVPTRPENGTEADTRMGRLAWHCVFGTDKEPRAARTSKMNMIMHGDGHGGIHWHDGLIDINGIFTGRFDVVLTNPPFGALVTDDQKIGATPEMDVPEDPAWLARQRRAYGSDGATAWETVRSRRRQPVLSLFEIGVGKKSRKTETLFLERCLSLLKPGGRMGIILPNGNLNAASLAWLRRWAEGKAYIRGVVALPVETFKFSKASVSASVVFLTRFTEADASRWETAWGEAYAHLDDEFDKRRADLRAAMTDRLIGLDDPLLSPALIALATLGVTRPAPHPASHVVSFPDRTLTRGERKTTVLNTTWMGTATDSGTAKSLKADYARLVTTSESVAEATSEFKAALKRIDDEQTAAVWAYVRDAFDYSVFMAQPDAVGITATGDTGDDVPNDLPEVLAAWRKFLGEHSLPDEGAL